MGIIKNIYFTVSHESESFTYLRNVGSLFALLYGAQLYLKNEGEKTFVREIDFTLILCFVIDGNVLKLEVTKTVFAVSFGRLICDMF